jgi:MFS transporter, DHA3 family, macrolide efflux protein
MPQTSPAPRGMKTFLIIWFGQFISILGSGLTAFALGVWIFQQTGQATPFALTVLFGSLPRILLSPLAGVAADRWNRRYIMILADAGSALVTLVAALLLFAGDLQIWHIYLVALGGAIFAAFQEPAYTASITLLVPKKELGRAAGMMQMSQALEMLIAPLLAGLLFVTIGLRGIILIDFITCFFAVGALLLVRIPQPERTAEEKARPASLRGDVVFGWRYLRARPGLFGILVYFALVNFLVNLSAVLTAPLVLSFASAGVLGTVQMVSGAGMFIGSVMMSAWGGPQRRILAVIGAVTTGGLGLIIVGWQPSAVFVGAGLFLLMGSVPFASGAAQAIFQSKVEPAVQGRVFAMRSLISRSMMPLAFLLAGPLADRVFEPFLREGGALANTAVAALIGVGPGRGIGLLFSLSGIILLVAGALAYANRHIRLVEHTLPDAIGETAEPPPTTPPLTQPAAFPLPEG